MKYFKAIIASIRLQLLGSKIQGEHSISSVFRRDGQLFVVLPRNPSTEVPGIQSLFWDSRVGHCLVEPIERNDTEITFKVLKSFRAEPENGELVWLSGWLGEKPEDFDVQQSSKVQLENGTFATLVRRSSSKWVVHVHGRNATIAETLRNFELFDRAGYNQLFLAHETDAKPEGLGRRKSKLGTKEWLQVEVAVKKIQELGGQQIVLFGWSLGAMFVGQFLLQSQQTKLISKVIMDSPLIDYQSTLSLQSKLAGYPASFGDYVARMLTNSLLLKLIGFGYRKLPDLVHEFNVPVLVLYSETDGYVSMDRIHEMKSLNEQMELREFTNGKHCRLYNQNQEFYKNSIEDFINSH